MASSKIPRICEYCGTEFLEYESRVLQGKGKYCSRTCLDTVRNTAAMLPCEQCNKPFKAEAYKRIQGNARFCSHACHAASRVKTVTLTCAQCHQEFVRKEFQVKDGPSFCGHRCAALFRYRDAEARFWSNVNKTEGCWIWTAAYNSDGYGMWKTQGFPKQAHRTAWIFATHGPIPESLHVLHRCDNPPCVRPDHLFLGTPKDNMEDASTKNRLPVGENKFGAKLSAEQVREIRHLRSTENLSTYRLAQTYGVCQTTIIAIISRDKWKSVPD